MMGFWTAIAIIAVVGIVTEFVVRLVKIGTKYSENIERIKHGYPTLDGTRPDVHADYSDKSDRLQ
jgi:hypothetical protein